MRYEYEVGDYVKIIANLSMSKYPIGYIGSVIETYNFPNAELEGMWARLNEEYASWSHFSELEPATKAEYEAYHKPKLPECKFKVGDKVKLLVDKVSKSFYTEALHYSNRLLQNSNSVFIVEAVTSNGRLEWVSQFIKVKGYHYEHPIDCFELYTEPQFKVGDWIVNIHYTHLIGKITSINGDRYYYGENENDYSKDIRLATDAEIKAHLLKEADRRGFKPGVSYIPATGGSSETALYNPRFYDRGLSVYDLECGAGRGLIYKYNEDKWATIIPKTKILCGHQVVNSATPMTLSIGCKTVDKRDADAFLKVCDIFNITKVMSRYVKDQSITLDAIKEALK